MGRPQGNKNCVKQSEEPPKTTRESTSIASSSSSCTSVPLVPIISHEQQINVVPSHEGFRGKSFRGGRGRGSRGINSTNNNFSMMFSVPNPNIVPIRGRGGRGRGRGNSISIASAFSRTTEQPALNIPDKELLSLPRSHLQQQDNTSLINSNALPPLTQIIPSILEQKLSPVMNLTATTATNLPSYHNMSLCSTTISSTIPSTSIANTSPSQINSTLSTSQVMANQIQTVPELLSDRLKEVWKKFIEEFHQVFDLDQLDPVLSLLKQLDCMSQNPSKKINSSSSKPEETSTSNNNNDNDNDIDSASSKLEKKVFGNHLLSKSVFNYLNQNELLACRLVNSYWMEYSTEILLKRNFRLKFERKWNRFVLHGSNWKSLDVFTAMSRSFKNFPCNKFQFDGGNLGNDDAQRFFSFYGSNVKSLDITLRDDGFEKDADKSEKGFSVSLTDSRIIGMILSVHLPNLEYLGLDLFNPGEASWPGFTSLLFSSGNVVVLPKLKSLVFRSVDDDDDYKPFLIQLLKAAVNLKKFYSWDTALEYLDCLIETRKVKCISTVDFNMHELDEFEKFANHGPEVEVLDLIFFEMYKEPQQWKRVSKALSKFFESSKKSLKEIKSFKSLGFLPQLQLPVLENIKFLELTVLKTSSFNPQDIHANTFSLIPPRSSFSRNFPRLNRLTIHFHSTKLNRDPVDWWTKCFPTDEIVPSVKQLEIMNAAACPPLWMRKFSSMFPNVTSLSIYGIKDFPSFSRMIWKYYQKLVDLTLDINISTPVNSRPFILDSSFTGIPLEECKRLANFSSSTLEQQGENFVENPSILKLKDLQTLRVDLTIADDDDREEMLDGSSILSPLTGVCAFNLLNNVPIVCIEVDALYSRRALQSKIEKALKPLTAYKVIIT